MKKLGIIAFLIFGVGNFVEGSELGVKEYSVHGGWLLPDQVLGMEEILPTWGIQMGVGLAPQGMLVAGYWNTLAHGVNSHHVDVLWRYSAVTDGVGGFLNGGVSLRRYNSYLLADSQQEWGALLGAGFMFQLSQEVWFQSEMRFRLEPGVQMLLVTGLGLRF